MNEKEHALEEEYLDRTVEFIDGELDKLSHPDWTVPHRDTAKALISAQEEHAAGLKQARPRPYFGRVDFTFSDGRSIEAYIGPIGVGVPGSDSRYVYDWRAPFPGQVYYADPNAEVSYNAPGGEVTGTLTRKRQYTIEDARLIEVTEVYRRLITDGKTERVDDAEDAFFQKQLDGGRSGRLHEAIATLQPDQYQQIAATPHQVMLVQGVAGSGKSIVGLHLSLIHI